jgi:quercetin dioxygenase-like cupin family protein
MGARFTPCTGRFDEREVFAAFEREQLAPHRWSNGAGDVYASHSHDYHKVLYCVRGSIVFTVSATSERIELHPGDRLDIEPQTKHSAVVGPEGVTCVEAARPNP